MSLVTLDEYRIALDEAPGAETSELVLFGRMAGISQSLAAACNRYFPSLASRIEVANVVDPNLDLIITVPFHGLAVGDRVRVETTQGVISGIYEITAVDLHTFTINVEATQVAAESLLDQDRRVSIRKVHTVVRATRGGDSLFLDPRPVAEIVSVKLDTTTLAATDYAVANRTDGVSLVGRLMLKTQTWPETYQQTLYVDGAEVSFVAGEAWPIPAVHMAMLQILENLDERIEATGYQSESYDYHSYSKMQPEQVGRLFGEADYIINQFMLANI